MTRFFVIFNPAARGEKSKRVQQLLASKNSEEVRVAHTARAGDATQLAARAVAEGYHVVVAAGGDGTVNEVVNGLAQSAAALAILPLGTVNVFARELGIPTNLDAAWQVARNGFVRTVDLAVAEAGGTCRYFAQLAGVGFDARAVRTASWELKKRVGPVSYVWAGLKVLREPPINVDVSVNGNANAARGAAIFVGNGRFYGGPFKLFPQARLDDGLLDVCVFERCGYLDVLRYGQGILRGVHTRLPDVRYFQAKEFVCHAAAAVPFELDGEDAGDAPVKFTVVPRALRVIVPKQVGGNDHA